VKKESELVRKSVEQFFNEGLRSALEIGQYADTVARKAVEQLQKVHYDSDFEKLVQFLNEENEVEQERMMIK
jgi:hypothetical protein